MSEDIIVEIGDVSAVDVDVTAQPQIVVEVQSIGGKGDPGDGLKEYATTAEVDAITEAEVGVLRNAATTWLDPSSGLPYLGDIIIQTQLIASGIAVVQTATCLDLAGFSAYVIYGRLMILGGAAPAWTKGSTLPTLSPSLPNAMPISPNGIVWVLKQALEEATGGSIAVRGVAGRLQVGAPSGPSDATNKGYVDPRSVKVYATSADVDAIRAQEVGFAAGLTGLPIGGSAQPLVITLPSAVIGTSWVQIAISDRGTYRRSFTAGSWTLWTTLDSQVTAPTTFDSFGVTGQTAWDQNYLYRCVAPSTWKRTLLTTW